MIKRTILSILLVGLTGNAHATLQIAANIDGTPFFCADGQACDTALATGILQISDQTISGVTVNGSIQTSTKGPPSNVLNTSSLSLINTTSVDKPITFTVADTDFVGPVTQWFSAGSGTWQNADGSTITLQWANDNSNAQGADFAGDVPGAVLDSFTHTAVGVADAFSHSGSGATSDPALFSMTENATGVLVANGQLINRGQTFTKPVAIPEPGSLGVIFTGLIGMVVARRRGWI